MGDIVLLSDQMPELLPMQGRSEGLHVSTIISDMCVRLGHYKSSEGPMNQLMLEIGSAFEHAMVARMERHYRDRFIQIGELERDDIFGTPDLLDTEDWAVVEIKLTWMSSRHEPDSKKLWRYWTQVKAYCHMAESTIGRLHVCHIMGDYKGNFPQYRLWEQGFSQQELAENWRMLQTHGERYL